jgi:hypothetical protein
MTMACTAVLAQEVDDEPVMPTKDPFHLVGGSLSFGFAQVSQHSEFEAYGPSLEFGLAGTLGTFADVPVNLEWAGYYGRATSHTSNTEIQGSDPLVYASGTSPVGSIDLSTFGDGAGVTSTGTVQIIDSTGDTASIFSTAFSPNALTAEVSQFALSQTDSGGAFTALTTNGQTGLGSAYGVIFDDTGFLVLGTGDNSTTAVTTSVDEKITAAHHTLFLSTVLEMNGQWTVAPRLGPTFRDLGRTTTSRTFIDLNEGSDLAATLPDILLAEKRTLKTEHYGAILGADFTRRVRENWLFSLGAEAGLTKFSARSSHSNTVSIAGTNAEIPGATVRRNGTSGVAKITADLTHLSKNGTIVTLGAFVDFLMDAPFMAVQTAGQPALTVSGSNIGLTGNGETYQTFSIEQKDMVSAGISLSIVRLF